MPPVQMLRTTVTGKTEKLHMKQNSNFLFSLVKKKRKWLVGVTFELMQLISNTQLRINATGKVASPCFCLGLFSF